MTDLATDPRIQMLLIWFFVYFAALGVVAFLARRLSDNSLQDFWNSTSAPIGLGAMILTFAATLFSAFFIVGIPGFAYTHGALIWPFVILGDIIGLIGLFFVGRAIILKNIEAEQAGSSVVSPLELIFENRASQLVALVISFVFILPFLAVQIGGFGALVGAFSDGAIDPLTASFGALAVIWLYTTFGGFRTIVWSDVIQGIVLLVAGCVIAAAFIGQNFTSPVNLLESAYENDPKSFDLEGRLGVFNHWSVFSSILMFAALFITQPQFLTRFLAIKSERPIRYLRHTVLGLGLLISLLTIPVILLGLGGAVVFPDLASGDQLLGSLLSGFSPWFGAFIVVAVLCASMSTADSILFSLNQIFVGTAGGALGVSEKALLSIGRVCLLFLMIIAAVLGFANSELIVVLSTLTFGGMLQMVPAILGGLFDRGAWNYAGLVSMMVGVTAYVLLFSNDWQLTSFHPSTEALILAILTYAMARLIKSG